MLTSSDGSGACIRLQRAGVTKRTDREGAQRGRTAATHTGDTGPRDECTALHTRSQWNEGGSTRPKESSPISRLHQGTVATQQREKKKNGPRNLDARPESDGLGLGCSLGFVRLQSDIGQRQEWHLQVRVRVHAAVTVSKKGSLRSWLSQC